MLDSLAEGGLDFLIEGLRLGHELGPRDDHGEPRKGEREHKAGDRHRGDRARSMPTGQTRVRIRTASGTMTARITTREEKPPCRSPRSSSTPSRHSTSWDR